MNRSDFIPALGGKVSCNREIGRTVTGVLTVVDMLGWAAVAMRAGYMYKASALEKL